MWLDRWNGEPPALVRAWTWNEHIQATSQNLWETLTGDNIELAPHLRALVARRTAWRRHNPYILKLLEESTDWLDLDDTRAAATTGDPDAFTQLPSADSHLLTFIDEWENGHGVDEAIFNNALVDHGQRRLVETQLIAGFVGTQSRLATSLHLSSI